MPTYLNEYISYTKKKTAYIPVGTIEWHGSHLPIETDFLVAQKICGLLQKKKDGYVLPPIYLGTDTMEEKNGKKLIGMDRALGKELKGSLYYVEPELFQEMIKSLVENLKKDGFKKCYIVTGHAGSAQIKTLKKLENKIVRLIDPYELFSVNVEHADEYETSLFWACYPEEEKKSRAIKISANDDFIKDMGYDVREKASLKIGKKMLKEMLNKIKI